MIELRKKGMDDLIIFKKWLSEPHVAKWYEHPLDWIYEIEKQDSEFNGIHLFSNRNTPDIFVSFHSNNSILHL